MKNKRLQFALFGLLIVLSLASFVYLNSLDSPRVEVKCTESKLTEENQDNSRIVLPDVELVKKLYRTGKRLLPASS